MWKMNINHKKDNTTLLLTLEFKILNDKNNNLPSEV